MIISSSSDEDAPSLIIISIDKFLKDLESFSSIPTIHINTHVVSEVVNSQYILCEEKVIPRES